MMEGSRVDEVPEPVAGSAQRLSVLAVPVAPRGGIVQRSRLYRTVTR